MPNNNIPQILIQPLKPALIAGVAQKLPVLIRVQAPDAIATEKKVRKPYHLALVIDRSGSMSGPPLLEAVRCAKHIADQIGIKTADYLLTEAIEQAAVLAPKLHDFAAIVLHTGSPCVILITADQ